MLPDIISKNVRTYFSILNIINLLYVRGQSPDMILFCFDILQGALQLGVAASGGEEILIEVNFYVGLNAHTLITLLIH